MKRYCLLYIILFLFINIASYGAYLSSVPQVITQPNGQIIHCFATGDEFYNWLHDENNFTIIQSPADGYYYYAILNNKGELIPSAYKVGKTNPFSLGLLSGINITAEKKQALRKNFYNKLPENALIFKSKSKSASVGTLNNIVVFIRFSDDVEYTSDSSVYSNLFNNTAGNSSLKNYFKEVSYNTLNIQSTFYPVHTGTTVISFQDSHPRAYYQAYNSVSNPIGYQGGDVGQQRTEREDSLLAAAVNAISTQVPANLNIDNDNDGNVDNICFIAKGNASGWNSLLWPHRWILLLQNVYIQGKKVWDFNFQLENTTISSGVGVLCHEMFHSLGAPDLYHYNGDGKRPVGSWDLMENNTNPPQSMGAFMKYRYGKWISDIPEITTNGTYSLQPITSASNNCYKIKANNSATEYFVLEYRKREGVYESSIYGSGLLIYRINTIVDGAGNMNGPPDEIYLFRQDGNTLQNGLIHTAFFSGNSMRNIFNPISNPCPFLSTGIPVNLSIYNISQIGSSISFTVGSLNIPYTAIDSASNVSNNSATIHSTVNAKGQTTHVEFEYGSSIAYGNIITLTSPLTNSNSNQHISKNITGLQAATEYHFRVKASNASGTTYSQDFVFNTSCNTFVLPSAQGFNSVATPPCWESDIEYDPLTPGGNNGAAAITFVQSSLYPTITKAFEGSHFIKFNSLDASDSAVGRLSSPVFSSMGLSNISVNFRWYTSSVGGNSLYPLEGLTVQWSSDGNVWNDIAFYPRYDAVDGWKFLTTNLPAAANNRPNVWVSFRFYSQYGYNCYMDNVVIKHNGPAAEFTANKTSIVQFDTVSFTDLSLSSISSRNWTFNGAYTPSSTSSGPQIRYDNLGSFPVTLSVNNANGSNAITKENYIFVSSVVNAGADASITCSGSVQLQATLLKNIGSSNLHYSWFPATGLNNPNISNPIASPTVTTTYVVTAIDTNFILRDTVTVNVNPLEVETLNEVKLNCRDSIQLNFTTNYQSGMFIKSIVPKERTFTIGTATFGASPINCFINANISYISDACGTYTACCASPYPINTYSNKIALLDKSSCNYINQALAVQKAGAKGLIIINSTSGVVNPMTFTGTDSIRIPVVMVSKEDGDTLKSWISTFGNVNISIGYDGPSLSYSWSPPTGLSNSTAMKPYASPFTNTTYTLVVSNGICSDTARVNVIINNPSLSIANDSAICNGGSMIVDVYQSGLTYLWSTGALTSAISISQAGVYHVKTTNAAGCYARDTINVTILPIPAAAGSILGADTVGQTTLQSLYSIHSILNAQQYQWTLLPDTAGLVIANDTLLTIAWNPLFSGNVSISAKGSNYCGIGIPSFKNIHISPKTLELDVFLEGLYKPEIQRMHEVIDGVTELPKWGNGIADVINIELHQSSFPYGLVQEFDNVFLSTLGKASVGLDPLLKSNYYISVSNRNHIKTWSAHSISFDMPKVIYNFKSNALQAYTYGDMLPQAEVSPNVFAIHLGDLDQGGWVDSDDFNYFELDLIFGNWGYLTTDFNGNGWVDAEDFNAFEPNLTLGVISQYP